MANKNGVIRNPMRLGITINKQEKTKKNFLKQEKEGSHTNITELHGWRKTKLRKEPRDHLTITKAQHVRI